MKTLPKAIGTLVLVLFGTLASGAAMAEYYGHGHRRFHDHGRNVRFGISIGVPIFGPRYYPAPYYPYPAYAYPPVVVAPASPPVYIELPQTPSAAPSQAQGDWYYCAESKAYYPYVSECPAGWQRVPAQPPTR
jgi:hypothetical protein